MKFTGIFLQYWKRSGGWRQKRFKTVEAARKYGHRLAKKDRYIVMRYGCIHIYQLDSAGDTVFTQLDL